MKSLFGEDIPDVEKGVIGGSFFKNWRRRNHYRKASTYPLCKVCKQLVKIKVG